jgi:hypothetical protein
LACAALVAAQAILLRCQIERPNGNVVLGMISGAVFSQSVGVREREGH